MDDGSVDIEELRGKYFQRYRTLLTNLNSVTLDNAAAVNLLANVREFTSAVNLCAALSPLQKLICSQRARLAITTLARRACWLDPKTRELLNESVSHLPEFLHQTYRFSVDYSDNYADTWPRFLGHLAGKPDIKFLEIGTLEGRSACWLLENVLTADSSRLVCIDEFEGAALQQGLYDFSIDSYGMSLYQRLVFNLKLTGASHRVTVMRGRSSEVLRSLSLSEFDFAFIDGSHIAKDVMVDAILTWETLKAGAILAFDDYKWSSPHNQSPLASPRPAVDAFLALFQEDYELLYSGEQVILRKVCRPS
jgi:predicted O-methyltransferase YrrM